MAPAESRSFSVSVVLPASGCEMIAKVRRLATSRSISASAEDAVGLSGSSATDSETGPTFQLYTTAPLEHPVLQVGAPGAGVDKVGIVTECMRKAGGASTGNWEGPSVLAG
jgi:hypothetical protein